MITAALLYLRSSKQSLRSQGGAKILTSHAVFPSQCRRVDLAHSISTRSTTNRILETGTKRNFHPYFTTHLPTELSSENKSTDVFPTVPPLPSVHSDQPAAVNAAGTNGNTSTKSHTVARIPLKSAKQHFGTTVIRGNRAQNEDTNQAGTINIPAFAKRAPISLVSNSKKALRRDRQGQAAISAFGDPQVFYFAVFDGHGGPQCAEFLRDELHGYIEQAAKSFKLGSSLRSYKRQLQKLEENQKIEDERRRRKDEKEKKLWGDQASGANGGGSNKLQDEVKPKRITRIMSDSDDEGKKSLEKIQMKSEEEVFKEAQIPKTNERGAIEEVPQGPAMAGVDPVPAKIANESEALRLERELCDEYRDTVGGYFKRFKPAYFDIDETDTGMESSSSDSPGSTTTSPDAPLNNVNVTIESVLTYAFLRADLDFISAQARKPDPDDPNESDMPLNEDEILGSPCRLPPSGHSIGGRTRFRGGSTASVCLVSTPTPAPFWHPAAHATMLVAHVGDTRVLLCETATGLPRPLTSLHHPSTPQESRRLQRFSTSMTVDSFGEERVDGTLANSRAFGDMAHKRVGVTAEPEITRVEISPAQYAFVVLCSDGVSGTLSDQEIVDIVKESKTPAEASRAIVDYATEISKDADNATCSVVRLGGWERRSEGGLGSLGTKEIRMMRKAEASNPRTRRT